MPNTPEYVKDPLTASLLLRSPRLGAGPGRRGFVDDTAGHVAVAQAVGLVGHRRCARPGLVGFLAGYGLWGSGASE